MKIIPLLKDPPAEYRGKPFWAWNGKLDKDELLRQVECFHEMGFGGFFIHSRTGLETEYLGEEWFDCVRACAEKAYSLGMETWLYDEDRWPSGTCGGEVTRERKNRLRFLSLYDSDEEALACHEVAGILARYAVKLDGENLVDFYKVESRSAVNEGYMYAVFAEEEQKCSDFYNGTAYIDTMNREVTEQFLKSTHEKYFEKVGDLFGTKIKGIFTDEPHRGPAFNGFSLSNQNSAHMTPYSGELLKHYKEKYGSELEYPQIYWKQKGESYNAVSAAYIDCLDDLFLENFAKPCRDWCKAHNLILTGHILHEDTLSIQASVTGSCMRYYEYMDYPGIDVLTEENNIYWAAKQCSSVSRQLGKKFTLSELYGATGWWMTLDRYKQSADWQAFFGINFRCPHLSWYTMKGEAKRDYPASILHQNAWYKEWKAVEDYFARIAVLTSEGKRLCDTLVMVPLREMWGNVRMGWMQGFSPADERIRKADQDYIELFQKLISENIDFDYGEEELLKKYGSVEQDGGKVYLKIGKVRYSNVLWNPADHYCDEVQTLLRTFAERSGNLVEDTEKLNPEVHFGCPKGVVLNAYKAGGDVWAYALNLDKKNSKNGSITVPQELKGYHVELWNFRTGEAKGSVPQTISFAPGEEKIIRFTKDAVCAEKYAEEYPAPKLPARMQYEFTEPNVLPLDEAVCTADGAPVYEGKKRNVLLLDRDIRLQNKARVRGGEMLQPWFVKKYQKEQARKLCDLHLAFTFFVKEVPQTPVYLALEETGLFCRVNGEPLGEKSDKFWVDKCFSLYPVTLKEGENRIELSGAFLERDGLEAVYLLGDFGVSLPNVITKLPETLTSGDVTKQGFPYYTGAVRYHTGITKGKYTLSFRKDSCAVVNIYGGETKQTLAFSPMTANVELKSELIIETVFPRRNTFGPLHQTSQSLCEPGSFLTDGADYSPFTPNKQGLFWTNRDGDKT